MLSTEAAHHKTVFGLTVKVLESQKALREEGGGTTNSGLDAGQRLCRPLCIRPLSANPESPIWAKRPHYPHAANGGLKPIMVTRLSQAPQTWEAEAVKVHRKGFWRMRRDWVFLSYPCSRIMKVKFLSLSSWGGMKEGEAGSLEVWRTEAHPNLSPPVSASDGRLQR